MSNRNHHSQNHRIQGYQDSNCCNYFHDCYNYFHDCCNYFRDCCNYDCVGGNDVAGTVFGTAGRVEDRDGADMMGSEVRNCDDHRRTIPSCGAKSVQACSRILDSG